jgi:hypothetical protein
LLLDDWVAVEGSVLASFEFELDGRVPVEGFQFWQVLNSSELSFLHLPQITAGQQVNKRGSGD